MIRWANTAEKITAAFVRSVRELGLYWDEHGLVLRVKPSGYKQWNQRLFIHGKRRELGVGPLRLVTLAEAGDAALANCKEARAGGSPRNWVVDPPAEPDPFAEEKLQTERGRM